MSEYRVTLSSTKQMPAVTFDGYFGKHAEFRIQRLSDRRAYTYAGNGGGKRFEERCQVILALGGIVVEAADPPTPVPDTGWKEAIVNQALEEAERLLGRTVKADIHGQ
jgi:hypothetical protein